MTEVVYRLDEVCSVTMGQAPSGEAYNQTGTGWPLIAGAGDFSNGRARAKKFTTQASKLSADGDIVLGIRASIGAKVWSDGVYCLGRGVAGLRPRLGLDAGYLWHWLTHSAPTLAGKGKGATFKQVNKQDIGEMPISLPPINEQRRIAGILDQADALRAKRCEALAHLDDLTQSIFVDMFGESAIDGSQTVRLDEIAHIASGITKGRRLDEISTQSVPYLAVSNVQDGALDLTTVKMIDATPSEIERYRLKTGDLVLTEGGDPDKLGRGTLWNDEIPSCIHQNHIFRVRISARESVIPAYLSQYMSGRTAKAYFFRAAKQTTGIASMNMTQLRALPVKIPAMEQQLRFTDFAAKVRRQISAAEAHLEEVECLFGSLQARAFAGGL